MKHGLAMVVVLTLAPPALAQAGRDSARAHFDRGTTLYDLGRYKEAAAAFEEAFSLENDAALLFNIGQAYRLANQPADAVRAYKSFLRRKPNASNRRVVEGYIATLQKRIEEPNPAEPQAAPPELVAPSPEPAPPPPRRGWVWGVIGGAAAVVVGAVVVGAVAAQPRDPSASIGILKGN
jgi:tetratricopeptide (TPR) repeat protein